MQNQLRCQGGQGPTDELCNGQDDDCDGVVDNLAGLCGIIKGECRAGRLVCVGGAPACAQPQGPTPELCNGKDDDCDGSTDEEPTDPDLLVSTVCGSTEGVCKPGILRCLGGVKTCAGAVEPAREACNGQDDDCDGTTDEGINPPGPCPPPGLPPGSALVGECRPGQNTCATVPQGGAAWRCVGGVGPAAEICDGKDQNCDGTVDDNAPCPVGFVCNAGECAPLCGQGESECPKDRACVAGVCIFNECVRTPCGPGTYCDSRRGCVDKCEGVTCSFGLACTNGVCTSCFTTGCPDGSICRGATCEPDTCRTISCAAGSYCRDGACIKSCSNVRCAEGQSCRDGVCTADRCARKLCPGLDFCDPATGGCRENPCRAIPCLRGQVCVPSLTQCIPDPCALTRCQGTDVCIVNVEGAAVCVAPAAVPGSQPTTVKASGSGCSCDIDGRRSPPGRLPAVAGLMGAMGLLRRLRVRKKGARR